MTETPNRFSYSKIAIASHALLWAVSVGGIAFTWTLKQNAQTQSLAIQTLHTQTAHLAVSVADTHATLIKQSLQTLHDVTNHLSTTSKHPLPPLSMIKGTSIGFMQNSLQLLHTDPESAMLWLDLANEQLLAWPPNKAIGRIHRQIHNLQTNLQRLITSKTPQASSIFAKLNEHSHALATQHTGPKPTPTSPPTSADKPLSGWSVYSKQALTWLRSSVRVETLDSHTRPVAMLTQKRIEHASLQLQEAFALRDWQAFSHWTSVLTRIASETNNQALSSIGQTLKELEHAAATTRALQADYLSVLHNLTALPTPDPSLQPASKVPPPTNTQEPASSSTEHKNALRTYPSADEASAIKELTL